MRALLLIVSAILVASVVFWNVTSPEFERQRQRLVSWYDGTKLAEHMRHANPTFKRIGQKGARK